MNSARRQINRYKKHLSLLWTYPAVRLLVFNLTGLSITAWLYLGNYILPATIGSRSNGERLVSELKSTAYLWATLFGYLILRCAFLILVPSPIKSALHNWYNVFAIRVRDLRNAVVFRLFLTINILLSQPRRSRPHLPLALSPSTYINLYLTD